MGESFSKETIKMGLGAVIEAIKFSGIDSFKTKLYVTRIVGTLSKQRIKGEKRICRTDVLSMENREFQLARESRLKRNFTANLRPCPTKILRLEIPVKCICRENDRNRLPRYGSNPAI
jgi:hypothetical protein